MVHLLCFEPDNRKAAFQSDVSIDRQSDKTAFIINTRAFFFEDPASYSGIVNTHQTRQPYPNAKPL
jgi:hypothetical protein